MKTTKCPCCERGIFIFTFKNDDGLIITKSAPCLYCKGTGKVKVKSKSK